MSLDQLLGEFIMITKPVYIHCEQNHHLVPRLLGEVADSELALSQKSPASYVHFGEMKVNMAGSCLSHHNGHQNFFRQF